MATTFDLCLIYHTQHFTFEPRHIEVTILNKPKEKPNRSSIIDGLVCSSKALHCICVNMDSVFEQDTERCVWVDVSISGPLVYTAFTSRIHTATGWLLVYCRRWRNKLQEAWNHTIKYGASISLTYRTSEKIFINTYVWFYVVGVHKMCPTLSKED